MSIERLDEEIILPYNQEAILSKDRERLNEYIKQFIGDLERFRLREIHERLNLLIDLTGAGAIFYLGTKDSTGDYPNGTWRINGESATEYLIQLRESGAWVTKYTLTSDGQIKAGGFGMQAVTVTAAYTVANGVYSIYANGTTAFSITMPTLTGQRSIRVYVAEGSADITAVGTVNEETNLVMCAGETWDFVDNGTTWTV